MIDKVKNIHREVKKQLEVSAIKYKMAMEKQERIKSSNEIDLVDIHLRKE